VSEFVVCEDGASLASAVAERFVNLARDATALRGQFDVALAGGKTPRAAYGLLGTPEFTDQVDWSRVQIFWGDERNVPADHPESNARLAREALLNQVPISERNIHRIRGEWPPKAAAQDYEREIREVLGEPPRFDLVLLGMGADGHTASLFPGSAAISEQERLVVAVYVEALKAWRVTLTLPVLNAARDVLMLVSGAEKSEALARIRAGQPLPAALVCPVDGNLAWLVDRAAAEP
jgi:6-phosphogluconolactonase